MKNTALFAKEIEFWIDISRIFWLDEGYTNPLFAPEWHYFNYTSTWSPCSNIAPIESQVMLPRISFSKRYNNFKKTLPHLLNFGILYAYSNLCLQII